MITYTGKSSCRAGRHVLHGTKSWSRFTLVLSAALLCLACGLHPAWAGPPRQLKPASYGYFDFPTCVRYALVHSKPFLSSRIEIQIKSSDLKDAHSDLLPTLKLEAAVYLNRAGGSTGNPVTVRYLVEDYNPLQALLEIKSQQIAVDIAKTIHKQKVSNGIAEIAKTFLEIEARNKLIRAQKDLSYKWGEKIDFLKTLADLNYRKRMRSGRRGGANPDQRRRSAAEKEGVDLAVSRWKLSQQEVGLRIETLRAERNEFIDRLKTLIGYHPDYHLPLDTRDAANQVLSGFNGRGITFGQIQGNNLALKILAKQEQLESNLVTGTYVAILPQPLVIFQDISNQVDRTSGLNFLFGFRYNLWDGFKGVRRIKRQKMEARQAKIEREEKSRALYEAYKRLRSSLEMANKQEALVRVQKTIAEKDAEQARRLEKISTQIELGLGRSPDSLPRAKVLNSELRKLETKLRSVDAWQSRAVALVELATLAGGLNKYNARIRH